MSGLFGRGDNQDEQIEAAQDYLRSTDHVSRPIALLLSLLGFVVVFAVIFSLFLGGRWLFDRLSDDDVAQDIALQADQDDNQSQDQSPSITTDQDQTNDQVSDAVRDETDLFDDTEDQVAVSQSNGDTPNYSDTSTTQTDDQTVVLAENDKTDEVDSIPRTGPLDTVALLAAVTIASGMLHYRFIRRKY